jgi:glycosyltransferase involved in cell wall biosynthesis
MTNAGKTKNGPLVSVLIPACGPLTYLPAALASAVEQTYPHLQIVVAGQNAGDENPREVVRSFRDSRIILLESEQSEQSAPEGNRPEALNRALQYAEGKYVAYLSPESVYYPNHIETLVDVLEGEDGCGVAYTDFYRTHCRILPDHQRQVLGKVIASDRDFDRWLLMHSNCIPHDALMHRIDLLDRTGAYNKSLTRMFAWDMMRRMALLSDFAHCTTVTGEMFAPIGEYGRDDYRMGMEEAQYEAELMTVRTSRPAKPWSKFKDLSIIFLPDRINPQSEKTLRDIARETFIPYEIIIPLPAAQLSKLEDQPPNVVHVEVSGESTIDRRIDSALEASCGDYIALVPPSVEIEDGWIEVPVYALDASTRPLEGIGLNAESGNFPPAVFRRDELLAARREHPHLSVSQSLKAAGVSLRESDPGEMLFLFDGLLSVADMQEREGNWSAAARVYEGILQRYPDELHARYLTARAFSHLPAQSDRGLELARELNRTRPTVDSLLLEATLHRRADRLQKAVTLLDRAEKILQRKG